MMQDYDFSCMVSQVGSCTCTSEFFGKPGTVPEAQGHRRLPALSNIITPSFIAFETELASSFSGTCFGSYWPYQDATMHSYETPDVPKISWDHYIIFFMLGAIK